MTLAQILKPTQDAIQYATRLLAAGQVVGMPTETVYGLAGDAFNQDALARIFSLKERPTFDPLIVHVAPTLNGILEYLRNLELIDLSALSAPARSVTQKMAEEFWPGPLTMVLPKHPRVPDLATSGLATVALRMPRHPVAQALLIAAGAPLAAPSANRFGRISPTQAEHVLAELGDRIPLILDGGPCEVGLESTVIAVNIDGTVTLLRPGGVAVSEIERILKTPVERPTPKNYAEGKGLSAPGLLESHYAPHKTLLLLPMPVARLTKDAFETHFKGITLPEELGLLLASGEAIKGSQKFSTISNRPVIGRTLSQRADLIESAQNLFSELRALDSSRAQLLFAEPFENEAGLGHAIADRLRRAAARRKD